MYVWQRPELTAQENSNAHRIFNIQDEEHRFANFENLNPKKVV